jgi:hypothetical protein
MKKQRDVDVQIVVTQFFTNNPKIRVIEREREEGRFGVKRLLFYKILIITISSPTTVF